MHCIQRAVLTSHCIQRAVLTSHCIQRAVLTSHCIQRAVLTSHCIQRAVFCGTSPVYLSVNKALSCLNTLAHCSCRVTDQLIQHYETSFSVDRDYQAPCRKTACPTCMTAGGQSGMATTTTHTMATVTLVAAPVGIHAGGQTTTPTSEWY
jgi:hypothetical protein